MFLSACNSLNKFWIRRCFKVYLEKAIQKSARDSYRRDAWGGMLGGIFTGIIFPFVGFIARDKLHASIALISMMTAAPFIGSMLALIYAKTAEGKSKAQYVAWPLLIGRGLFLFTIFAYTPLTFAMIVFGCQLISGIIGPAYAGVMKEIYPDDQRGIIMAYIRIGATFMLFVATMLSGWLLKHMDFRYLFLVAGVFGLLSGIVFKTIKTVPADPEDPNVHQGSMLHFLGNTLSILKEDRLFCWFSLAIFVGGFGNLMVAPIYPIFQVDNLHITATQIAVLSNVATIFWMMLYPYWGKYVDLRSPLRATMVNQILSALIPLNYFLISFFMSHKDPSIAWWLIPSSIIAGIVTGGTELAYFNSIMHFAPDGMESRYQALHSFLLGVRGTIAPFVGAGLISLLKVFGADVRYVFLLGAVLLLAGALLQAIGTRRSN